jgi:thioredoxin-dependent peroxiredoxin
MAGIPMRVGDEAPLFKALTQDGSPFSLADYRGKQAVVLYFYPKDNTAVCTAEACAFRDAYEDFVAGGAVVVGVSGDSQESHKEFASRQRLPFILIADPSGTLRNLYGVPKTLWIFPGRVTYVIDKQGIVRHIFHGALASKKHVDKALGIVRLLAGAESPNP